MRCKGSRSKSTFTVGAHRSSRQLRLAMDRSPAKPFRRSTDARKKCPSLLSSSLPMDITRMDPRERAVTALPRTAETVSAAPASCPSARSSLSSRRLLLGARSHSAAFCRFAQTLGLSRICSCVMVIADRDQESHRTSQVRHRGSDPRQPQSFRR
jgi:hypothetical protein